MAAPRKCHVVSREGMPFDVDCDGFALLDNGFVILKRYVPATADTQASEKTVAIFDRPIAVLLGEPENVSTPGVKEIASG